MSVFLRWGIFGILGVAALLYAYNASKHMAQKRSAPSTPVIGVEGPMEEEPATTPEAASPIEPVAVAEPLCEAELIVAERAVAARSEGEPLDRLLRIQEIAFAEPARRQRLEKVAARWFNSEVGEVTHEAMRKAVIRECVDSKPATPAP
jgi:hypothetical protein